MDNNLVFTGEYQKTNWFYSRYYYDGANYRYATLQVALNLLNQRHVCPTIIETGCQRQEEDLGAGMSTSIFAEYISRYGGHLISVDIEPIHLERAKSYLQKWPDISVAFVPIDSVFYLQCYNGPVDLVYLDSLDYPVTVDIKQQKAAQQHCLNELLAIEPHLSPNSIVLLDDNLVADDPALSGGKPKLAKQYLESHGWTCLLDLQQSLWVKEI